MSSEFIGEGTPLGDVPENIPSPKDDPTGQNPFPEDFGVMKTYKKGEIVAGKIVEIQHDAILIDIQTKTEGVLQKDEISFAPNPTTDNFNVGDEIEVMVIKEGEDIYMLSKKRVDEKKIWDRVAEAQSENNRMEGKIIAAVNGGLIVDIGGRAFLPQSQIDIKKIDNLESMIGQEIEVKVLEHDREKNRLVVSRRLCIEEDLDKEKLHAFDNFKKGQTIDGKVEKIVDYGVFVNLGEGMTGLLHVSELSWERVDNPRSLMKVGDPIQVKVLKVDKEKQKISLSRKATLPEPWDAVAEKFKPGTITEGKVTRVTSFGCFIKLDDYFEGLAHISELVDQRINHAKEVFNPGDKVTVLVLDVDKKRKRIRLSVKKALERQTEREVSNFMRQQGELDNTLGSRFGGALSSLDLDAEEAKKEVAAAEPEIVEEKIEEVATEVPEEKAVVEESAVAEEPVSETTSEETETTENL